MSACTPPSISPSIQPFSRCSVSALMLSSFDQFSIHSLASCVKSNSLVAQLNAATTKIGMFQHPVAPLALHYLASYVPSTFVSLSSAIAHGRHLSNRFRLLNSFSVFANQIETARKTRPSNCSLGFWRVCIEYATHSFSTWAAHEQGASFRSVPRFQEKSRSANATTNKQISRRSAR